jgi:DtxR family Mn-dependent transcriptional regulator
MYDHRMAAEHATAAEEEYLESLFWLFEAGLPMTGANLARAMQLSAPTVHEMLGRLERDGYILRDSGRAIDFTPEGREHAEHIVSRHRMIERFLTDVVGVPWDDVHEEAEQLEHAMTPRFEAYVRASVGDAKTCPHGHPIRVGERIAGVPLADCAPGAKVKILRLENEAEDLLHYLKEAGIEPGLEGEVASNDGEYVTVDSGGRGASVTVSVAETVSVLADPSPPTRIALPEQLVLGKERYGR